MARNTLDEALSITRFLEVMSEESGDGCRIAIIDSGAAKNIPATDTINLTTKSIIDTEKHGSAIHALIHKILPEAEIYLVKVPDPVPDNVLITALSEAMRFKPHAINLSITSEAPSDGTDPSSIYVDHTAQRSVVAVAAGNGGPKLMSVGTPAVAREALTVGGCTVSAHLWRGSSRGPTLDGRWKPNVLAPTNFTTRIEGGSMTLMGTSFATPFATALAAIVMKKVGDAYACRRMIELSANPIPLSAAENIILQGLRKASLIRRLLETWPRLTDPRNHTGMGVIDAASTVKLAARLRTSLAHH